MPQGPPGDTGLNPDQGSGGLVGDRESCAQVEEPKPKRGRAGDTATEVRQDYMLGSSDAAC
jgi:hypothetical protein